MQIQSVKEAEEDKKVRCPWWQQKPKKEDTTSVYASKTKTQHTMGVVLMRSHILWRLCTLQLWWHWQTALTDRQTTLGCGWLPIRTYILHKPIRRRFAQRWIYSKVINDLYQIDLVDLMNLSTYNDGYRHLLNGIDSLYEASVVHAGENKEWSQTQHCNKMHAWRSAM